MSEKCAACGSVFHTHNPGTRFETTAKDQLKYHQENNCEGAP